MSTLFSLENAAEQVAHRRLDDAERARLVRSIRQSPRSPRRSIASTLRQLAERIEPAERACLDC